MPVCLFCAGWILFVYVFLPFTSEGNRSEPAYVPCLFFEAPNWLAGFLNVYTPILFVLRTCERLNLGQKSPERAPYSRPICGVLSSC